MNDNSFDNGIVITGMLSNLGAQAAGTIESFFINGNQQNSWLSTVAGGWHGVFG